MASERATCTILAFGMTAQRPLDEILTRAEWIERARNHRARARGWTQPMQERRARGEKHPVFDFLHTYYRLPLGRLEAWHPGAGVRIEDCEEARRRFLESRYRFRAGVCEADPRRMRPRERERLRFVLELLRATRDRAPNFACHGLHEWAMVYGGADVRHRETATLRLAQDEIDALVESRPLCCSHFDAFRFFAAEARPWNRWQPASWNREEHEQPGCLHANMDLYKWAAKATPWTGSELLWECFELAVRARELDMRASPYDLRAFGYEPIKIETQEGRAEYERAQKSITEAACPLRSLLIGVLENILAGAESAEHSRADAAGTPTP